MLKETMSYEKTKVKDLYQGSSFDKAAYNAYEAVKAERDSLKESETLYKRKVLAVEEDAENLLKSYQGIYAENKVLRSKIEHGPDASRIKTFRGEIKRLEEKVTSVRSENAMLTDEIARLQKQLSQNLEEKKRIEDAFKMERGLHEDKTSNIEKEKNALEERNEKLERSCKEYEFRIKHYEEESDGLLHRYKELKRDNLKMETKFKKQKDLIEEEVRDLKETSKDMAKEIIQLKSKLARLQSEYQSVKLDYEAARKQIEYQNKELEVHKTQSSVLKRNAKMTNREFDTIKEELKTYEEMLEDERKFGFETVFVEVKDQKRKERKLLKRIGDLELQREELQRENQSLEQGTNECRRRMESSISEYQALAFANSNLKRRVEVLENSNLELDRRSKFMFDANKKGLVVTMGNETLKNVQKEKSNLLAKVRFLETENRRLSRRIKELENENDFEETTTVYSFRTSKGKRDNIIHADMPSLNGADFVKSSYRKTMKASSKSFPSSY
ncbi:girdin-like [Mya arenaria]|uniref:girdin-like n=1 Tax=Mya arenaria TaxID=6604 RepID=UPI0022E5D429|nr:girdin-like [Mya arenaria]